MQFKNLQEATKYLSDENVCRELLANMRWEGGKPVCPKCGKSGAYSYHDKPWYKCSNKECKNRFSVTKGTFCEGTKLPLSKWFIAMWLIGNRKKGTSSLQIARDLSIGRKAAWFLLHRVRAMLEDKAPTKLTGFVQVDESWIGGTFDNMSKGRRKKYRANGNDNKYPVMGMVDNEGNTKLKVIGVKSLKEVIKKNIDNSAYIITDSHNGYTGLDKEYAGHTTVNHYVNEFVNEAGFTTNSVEGFFSCLKRSIVGTYHSISRKHLQAYCTETSFRYNTRKITDKDRFINMLQRTEGRLKYTELINRKYL